MVQSLKELPIDEGKKVLVRVDFNVPLDKEGNIRDDTRIQATLPTIEYLLSKGASVILMSHLGRPKGKKDPALSLKPCAERLSQLVKQEVKMAPDSIGSKVEEIAKDLKPKEILVLENLRFHPEEEKPELDETFAEKLAKLGDFYVNDAFGTAHRKHSSTATIARFFQGRSAAGFLLEKEIEFLGKNLQNPKHPFYAIIGGAKVSSKLGVLHSLLSKVDALFIGGGMAYTFLKVKGISIGNSLCEDGLLDQAREFLNLAEKKKIPLYFPVDLVIADDFDNEANSQIISTEKGIPDGFQGMGIGPKTIEIWCNTLRHAQTIFWNGPLGVFEFPKFAEGTYQIAKILADCSATTIIGGGDSVAAINKLGINKNFSHISTGGGASLEYIEIGHLPGIDAL